MNIPLNGRIAIIDDKVEQAQPLMNIFAQKRCSCTHYTGELRYLPGEEETRNDIRLLFLDINLLDDAMHTAQQLRGKLVPVLKRVISPSNFPWVLIYWSRHEEEHDALVRDIFDNILHDRKPIAWLSQNKSNFFSMDGTRVSEFDANIDNLFAEISRKLQEEPAYRQLIEWENVLHNAADKTLQDIFGTYHANWRDHANYLLERLGKSYAGKFFKPQSPEQRIKSAFQTLNTVFSDTLEYAVNNTHFAGPVNLPYDSQSENKDIYRINKKLLLSDDKDIIDYSGMVIQDTSQSGEDIYNDLLNRCFNREKVKGETDNSADKKGLEKRNSQLRGDIRASWKRIHLVVTPLCDVVQGKAMNVKVILGFLIRADLKEYIDQRSEAIFISPKFQIEDNAYALVLDLRYFHTVTDPDKLKQDGLTPLFRIRQTLLSEIQSRLARHISRQGVLFIDDFS